MKKIVYLQQIKDIFYMFLHKNEEMHYSNYEY